MLYSDMEENHTQKENAQEATECDEEGLHVFAERPSSPTATRGALPASEQSEPAGSVTRVAVGCSALFGFFPFHKIQMRKDSVATARRMATDPVKAIIFLFFLFITATVAHADVIAPKKPQPTE